MSMKLLPWVPRLESHRKWHVTRAVSDVTESERNPWRTKICELREVQSLARRLAPPGATTPFCLLKAGRPFGPFYDSFLFVVSSLYVYFEYHSS